MGILPGVVLPWQKLKSNRKSNKSTFNNIKRLFRFGNRGLMKKICTLNIYKLNIYHVINIMLELEITQYQNWLRISLR